MLIVAAGSACDSKDEGGDAATPAADKKEDAAAESQLAKKANEEVQEMTAELEKGEDIKYACAGNLAQYEDLQKSSDEAEKKAWAAMAEVCYVQAPKKLIADLRGEMEKGEVDTMSTVDLETMLEDEDFPKEGEPAKVAAEAKNLLEIELPTHQLGQKLEEAKKEKEAGESVSMGCIEAKQIVDKSGKALEGDENGKAALAQFAEICPDA